MKVKYLVKISSEYPTIENRTEVLDNQLFTPFQTTENPLRITTHIPIFTPTCGINIVVSEVLLTNVA